MSCWVAPSLAAEMWGLPLATVLDRIKNGDIQTKHDGGFTFVDVAPYGPRLERPNLPVSERPPTFSMITEQEMIALEEDDLPDAEVELDSPVDELESASLGDWRNARLRAGTQRRAPVRVHA